MRKIAVILSLILSLAATGMAQSTNRSTATRTVTNVELDRFKQKRLVGAREYRENYVEMGFPSPEELERQIDRDNVLRAELSAKLRSERLEKERIEVDRLRANAEYTAAIQDRNSERGNGHEPIYGYGSYGGYWSYGRHRSLNYYSGFGGFRAFDRRARFGFGGVRLIPGYRATPAGVFSSPIKVPSFDGRRGGRRLR